MKKDKINEIIRYAFDNEIPDDIKPNFKSWLVSPHDKEIKEKVLSELWETLSVVADKKKHEKGLKKLHNQINPERNIIKFWRVYRKIAAVVVFGLFVFGSGYLTSRVVNEDNQKFYLVTANKSKGEFILPDGTKVWLNSNSRLTYDNDFSKESRNVELEGEAFFEVTKDTTKAFNVEMDKLSVQVLGTKFNARNYKHETIEEVVLIEGSVQISGDIIDPLILNPNEKFTLDKKCYSVDVKDVVAYNYSTWFDKHLDFEDAKLGDIFTQLGKWYNIDIAVDPDVNLDSRMSLKVYYEPLDNILGVISTINGLEYNISTDKVTITN